VISAAVFRNCLLAGLLPVLLAGCGASVKLNNHYEPPAILVPPPASARASTSASVPAFELPPPPAQPLPATLGQPRQLPAAVGQPHPLPAAAGQPQPLPVTVGQLQPQPQSLTDGAPSAQALSGDANLVTFTTRLSGASTVPPADSGATGQLDALYDANSGLLRWKAAWSGLRGPITAVQFHGPAQSGQTAPPAIIWPAPFGPAYEGRAALTPQQAGDLRAGHWYVNVFTTAYPAGELRGQLRQVGN